MMMKTTSVLAATMLLLASAVAVDARENQGRPRSEPVEPQAVGGLGMTLMSAVLDANGTLVRGNGVNSVVKAGVGNYRVVFTRNVRSCTYVATIGLSGSIGTEVSGSIDVAGDSVDVKGVFVDIENFAGGQVDRGFHLIVFCAR
jgi:hypothetical protein